MGTRIRHRTRCVGITVDVMVLYMNHFFGIDCQIVNFNRQN